MLTDKNGLNSLPRLMDMAPTAKQLEQAAEALTRQKSMSKKQSNTEENQSHINKVGVFVDYGSGI
jgi:hypothetical protein